MLFAFGSSLDRAGIVPEARHAARRTVVHDTLPAVRECPGLPAHAARSFVLLLSPFAPHLGEELWHRLGNEGSLAYEPWPAANRARLLEDTISLAVQVNGKRRDQITVARDAPEEVIREAALACDGVRRHLAGREPARVIVVAGRLVNVVG